ncbi:MAG: trypsin-like peptidase domain-containing protein [Nocardioidaceae bacterium]|nr:trypsin-like peptidase domain-containing protein [Nocardioidaceae bacterium]
MSESEYPGSSESGSDETTPYEPTTSYEQPVLPPPVPPAPAYDGGWPEPAAPEPAASAAVPPPDPTAAWSPVPVWDAPITTPAREAAPESGRPRLPGWTWPLVSALALVIGLVGGVVGASLVGEDDETPSSGGVLSVQRRTAAPLPADNGSIAAVAAKVLPSTVQIVAEYKGKAQGATGSGFVFDKEGHVITNNHVVADAASDDGPIDVIDQDGRHMPATVVGRSTVYDIAVLKVKGAERLEPAALGSSDQMHVGETVVAFGSPLGLSATVTSGIISAVNRPVTTGDGSDSSYINAVQTDAAINPGNSGGPLVDLQGQVIGVNSAIASLGSSVTSDEGGNIGVGFAIPIEQVQVTTDQILRTGKALYPVIGANVRGTAKLDGATVESISAGSPASKSDLKVGDVITRVDGQPVSGSSDVVVAVRSHRPGESVTLTVRRGGKTLTIKVGLEAKVG